VQVFKVLVFAKSLNLKYMSYLSIALFCQVNSVYFQFDGCTVFTEKEDALSYSGQYPVICHPPCRLFGRLRHFSTAPLSEKALAYYSVALVRSIGGVIEHPAGSKLWSDCDLPLGSNRDAFDGWTLSINQSWFGHPATKNTWLYIVGCDPGQIPNYPISFDAVQYSIKSNSHKSALKPIPKSERSTTPFLLAKWLIELTSVINSLKK